jgi:hypothetical protein
MIDYTLLYPLVWFKYTIKAPCIHIMLSMAKLIYEAACTVTVVMRSENSSYSMEAILIKNQRKFRLMQSVKDSIQILQFF